MVFENIDKVLDEVSGKKELEAVQRLMDFFNGNNDRAIALGSEIADNLGLKKMRENGFYSTYYGRKNAAGIANMMLYMIQEELQRGLDA